MSKKKKPNDIFYDKIVPTMEKEMDEDLNFFTEKLGKEKGLEMCKKHWNYLNLKPTWNPDGKTWYIAHIVDYKKEFIDPEVN